MENTVKYKKSASIILYICLFQIMCIKLVWLFACIRRSNVVDSDDESEVSEEEVGKTSYSNQSKDNKKAKKAGRKQRWSQDLLNNVIDIIVNNDVYKTKLIFVNVKTQKNGEIYKRILEDLTKRAAAKGEEVTFNIIQLRSKF